jgi:hypothetical protein
VASTVVDAKKEVIEALELIARHVGGVADARPVQLLALRRYLRLGGTKVHANWAWTPEQAQQFASTGGGKLLANEAAKVQRQFAADNPGYTLVVSPLRNLERQVRLWNANNSVHRAGARLLADMAKELADEEEFPAVPTGESLVKFKVVLRSAPVTPEPTSAAPGTSDHGQSRLEEDHPALGAPVGERHRRGDGPGLGLHPRQRGLVRPGDRRRRREGARAVQARDLRVELIRRAG